MHHSSAMGAKFTFAGKYYAAPTNLAYLTRDFHFMTPEDQLPKQPTARPQIFLRASYFRYGLSPSENPAVSTIVPSDQNQFRRDGNAPGLGIHHFVFMSKEPARARDVSPRRTSYSPGNSPFSPTTIFVPSGEKAKHRITGTRNDRISTPRSPSQRRAIWSLPQVKMVFPSGENAN